MIDLEKRLQAIEQQKKRYRILMNRSRFREEVDKAVWMHAAELSGRMDLKPDTKETSPKLQANQQGARVAFETVRLTPKDKPLTVDQVIDWHYQLMRFENPNIGGIFRRIRAHWMNTTMILANWEKVPALTYDLINGINIRHVPAFYWDELPDKQFQSASFNPVMQAIEANYNAVATHPFQDGNKRTARLISAWVLKRNDYIPLTVYNREDYISGIEMYYNTRRPHAFYDCMLEQMNKSYQDAITEAQRMETIYVPQTVAAHKQIKQSHYRRSKTR